MSKTNDNETFQSTAPAIMTFPALFTPRKAKRKKPDGTTVETGEPRYEANFLFDAASPDWATLKALAVKIAKTHGVTDFTSIGFPFKNGTKEADKRKAAGKDDGEYARGKGILSAKSGQKYQPKLTVIVNNDYLDLATPEQKDKFASHFYSGVKAWFQVTLAWYDAVGDGGRPGVTAYLNVVLSTNAGDRIGGGGQTGSQLFRQHLGQTTAENPTVDDEIPF